VKVVKIKNEQKESSDVKYYLNEERNVEEWLKKKFWKRSL
jgi:hypothetical protein